MYIVSDELYHHGILGQKWGIRRYQNKDGSLTDAGRVRYRGLAGKVRYIQDISKNKKRLKKMAEGRKRAAEVAKQTAENKKKWSKNAYDLEKHMDEYTPQEYAKAKADLLERESLRKIQMEEVRRGKEYFDTAANVLIKGIDIYTKMSAASTAAETARNMKATADKSESSAVLAIAKNAAELASLKKGDSGKSKDEGSSDSGSNKPKDKGPSGDDTPSKTDNSSPRHTGNGSKDTTSSNSETSSSNSKSGGSEKTSEPKPSFYSKLKEGAKKAADSFESMAEKTSSSGANETARAQAQAQNQAFSSSKESVPVTASKINKSVKKYSNMKVDEALDYIDKWTDKTLDQNSAKMFGGQSKLSFSDALKDEFAVRLGDISTDIQSERWRKKMMEQSKNNK